MGSWRTECEEILREHEAGGVTVGRLLREALDEIDRLNDEIDQDEEPPTTKTLHERDGCRIFMVPPNHRFRVRWDRNPYSPGYGIQLEKWTDQQGWCQVAGEEVLQSAVADAVARLERLAKDFR